jgi:hypothetical protein
LDSLEEGSENAMSAKSSIRKYLSGDALVALLRACFATIHDPRPGKPTISLTDALLAAYAMFALKDPSLLAFDQRRHNGSADNLHCLYKIEHIPCDTQMRTILDPLEPDQLKPAFQDVFRQLQRGKVLESYRFLDDGYLLALDGTEYFHSNCIHCPNCMQKQHRHDDGTITISYHHQMLGAVILHPDKQEVIPVMPEPINKQDGAVKNDCERNAAKRFITQFREVHPYLDVIVVEDALASNAPHIKELVNANMHFILGVKEGDHEKLFEEVRRRQEAEDASVTWATMNVSTAQGKLEYRFSIVRDVPLNESNEDVRVTFVWCIEENIKDGTTQVFAWVTDLEVTKGNVYKVMRAGRARWKIENETFNTLKNQGYQYERNFGHGQENLSVVFALLMMLAFLVDQVMQLCDPLFRGAWQKQGSKRALWESQRALVYAYRIRSLRELYEALWYGHERPRLRIEDEFSTS